MVQLPRDGVISVMDGKWQRISSRCWEAEVKKWRITNSRQVTSASFRHTLNVSFFNIYSNTWQGE